MLRNFYIRSCHMWRDSTRSPSAIWIPLISFPCVIALARTSGLMLNRSSKSGHSVLFLILGGKLAGFHRWRRRLLIFSPFLELILLHLMSFGVLCFHSHLLSDTFLFLFDFFFYPLVVLECLISRYLWVFNFTLVINF